MEFDSRSDLAFPKFGEGCCINCGFLCKVLSMPSRQEVVWEADILDRAQGRLFRSGKQSTLPRCFRWYANLMEEIGESSSEEREASAYQVIARTDRNCPKWFQWFSGFSPQWHLEQLLMRELEELRQANALKLAELQQKSQGAVLEIVKAQQQISEDHLEFVKISDRQTTRFNLMFAVLAFVALVLAVGALAYPNGTSWLEWIPGQESTPIQSTPNTAGSPTPTG